MLEKSVQWNLSSPLNLRKENLGVPRLPPRNEAFEGAKPSHQQIHGFDKTPYKKHTGLLSQQLKVRRFFVKVTKNVNPKIIQLFE